MRFDRRLLEHFEWMLLFGVLAICGAGISTVYSATQSDVGSGWSPLAIRQLAWFVAGVIGLFVSIGFDYRRLERRAMLVYVVILLAVALVPLVGSVAGGSRRWLRLGPVAIQPSEFMKIGIVIVLAQHFARVTEGKLTLRDLWFPLILTGIPAVLILAQPDLGSAVVLCIVAATMLVIGGVPIRWLAFPVAPTVVLLLSWRRLRPIVQRLLVLFVVGELIVLAVAGVSLNWWPPLLVNPAAVAAPMVFAKLKPYQQERVLTFIDPSRDPMGAGYHINQSKIAVGSGMVWGKGFTKGTQNHLNFLPEQHTDFIFCVFAEERGFAGAAILMCLYFGTVLRALFISMRASDRFGVLLAIGVTSIVFWQVVVNVGMTTGLMPVVGIPLPFFSYGGSSMVCLLVGTGLVMNVGMRRYLLTR